MNELNRIKQLIERVESKNFHINEQDVGFWGGTGNLFSALGNILNMGADAIGGLTTLLKDLTGDGIPWLINQFDNTAVIKRAPASGDIFEVTTNTAKALSKLSESKSLNDSLVYNALVLVVNFIDGVRAGSVTSEVKEYTFWKAMEIFTIGIDEVSIGGGVYNGNVWSKVIMSDSALKSSAAASSFIKSAFSKSDYSMSSEARNALTVLSELFTSGDNVNRLGLPNNSKLDGSDDRLDDKDGWSEGISKLYIALSALNITPGEDGTKELSEFERKLFAEFDCATELRKKMVVKYSSQKKEEYGVVEDNGYRFIIREKDGKFYGAIQYKGEVISRIKEFNCSGYNTFYDEGPESDLNEQQQYERVDGMTYTPLAGTKFTIVMTQAEYDKIKAHNAPKPKEEPVTEPTPKEEPVVEPTPEVQPSDDEATVDDTDTDIEVVPTPDEKPKSNVDKLIEVLIDNGYDERAAKAPNLRAVDGSVAVSNYLGRIVTQKEYEVKEEDYYADIFMKSILDGKTKFKKGTEVSTHDAEAKEENRIIDTTVGIEQPTEIEKRKLEELGSDADAVDRRNTLLFDKKRIKTVRLTSDNSTVIYVANEDITDLVSQISRSLDKTFGGTWALDETRNKYLTKNKIFIFKKVK